MRDCENFSNWDSKECKEDTNNIQSELFKNINIYDLYGECIYVESSYEDNQLYLKFLKGINPNHTDIPPCCAWEGAYQYLQDKEIRAAFNIPDNAAQWKFCQDLDYISDYRHGSLYTYPILINAGLRIWVYSGDVDGSVPFTGTRKWIKKLDLPVQKPLSSWFVDGQVAGYSEVYSGLTFLTIKGAGHMVPQWKRPQAHYFINKFLQNQAL